MPFAAQVAANNVYLVRAPWNNDYIDELTAFPNAAHDDRVDASSGGFNNLGNIVNWADVAQLGQVENFESRWA